MGRSYGVGGFIAGSSANRCYMYSYDAATEAAHTSKTGTKCLEW